MRYLIRTATDSRHVALLLVFLLFGTATEALAQDRPVVAYLEADVEALQLVMGESQTITVKAYDESGEEVEEAEFRYRAPRGRIEIHVEEGRITALEAGEHEVSISLFPSSDVTWTGDRVPRLTIPVRVSWPAIEQIEIAPVQVEARLYEHTALNHAARALHADGSERPRPEFEWSSSDPEIASVDAFGNVRAHQTGEVTISASFEGATGSATYEVVPHPGERIELSGGRDGARTGDVLRFEATVYDAGGQPVEDAPIDWYYQFTPPDTIEAPGAGGELRSDGRFVAQVPGHHTITALSGQLRDYRTVDITDRDVIAHIDTVGHGRVSNRRTSDFWVFEGQDGRDYAISGTWGSGGWAYFWDVTDPSNLIKFDSLQVDARTVNDVKVSPDARYAVLTREGASNRRNGVVIIDLADPQNPEVAAEFTENLTGGVHNAWPMNDYLYALSGGDKYVILDMADIYAPQAVGEYNHPNSRIHDLWVEDGIAYSAEWATGVVIVDVGNGRWGGTPEEPVYITNIPNAVGRTHDIKPVYREETGTFLLFAGDEIIGRPGMALEGGNNRAPYDPETGQGGTPRNTAGYIHIIEWDPDTNDSELIARYHVPEYGTHNIWVKDDVLYQAYYEGGVRVVDVSGELMGDLKRQGREMAVFKPYDPVGYVANAPTTWSAMEHKGLVWISDANSGIWALELRELDIQRPQSIQRLWPR